MGSATYEVRNICLVGHSGSGKTKLAESILKRGGAEVRLDTSSEAKARGYSIDLNMGFIKRDGSILNILDTPGFAEFIEELYKGVRVAETTVLVLNAEKGVEVGAEKAWELTRDFVKPSLVFINKMDLENANFDKTIGEMREKLEGDFALLQIPIREGNSFAGVVDLVENSAIYFDKRKGEIPAELGAQAAEGREGLLEHLAEVDDELMMQFLEEQEIATDKIKAALKEGMRRKLFTPVLCGSALEGLGIDLLLETMWSATPSFSELEGDTDISSSLIFNLAPDPYLGQLSFVKVYGGGLRGGNTVINLSKGAKERIKDIYRVNGDSSEKVERAEAGEVVALVKLAEASLGDTLATDENGSRLKLADFPKPVFSRALTPMSQADEEKMSTAVRELTDTKATLQVQRDDVTKETLLWGMGDTHLTVFAERLKNRFGVSVKMDRPRVPYKETIQKTATGQYRHKKQTGGRGQYGEVYLRVEPLERGAGVEFADEIRGGVIPQQFIPGVEKGVIEATQKGVLAGYPATDIRVAAYDGSHHSVDSSEIAFKIAAARAYSLAMGNASPVLLEPIMKLKVWTPSEFTGDIMSSLNGKRARISGMEPEAGKDRIEAEAPLAEIQDYALELKSLTQGRATFQMEFSGYQPVTSEKLAEELLKREKRGKE